jgi:hypothetical protein
MLGWRYGRLTSREQATGDLIKGVRKKDIASSEQVILVTSNKVKEAFAGL